MCPCGRCSELGAQVQDLREVCKTSAADRAAAEAQQSSPDVESPSPRSSIQLPTAGPVVIPGKLVNLTAHESSPHNAQETTDRDSPAKTAS